MRKSVVVSSVNKLCLYFYFLFFIFIFIIIFIFIFNVLPIRLENQLNSQPFLFFLLFFFLLFIFKLKCVEISFLRKPSKIIIFMFGSWSFKNFFFFFFYFIFILILYFFFYEKYIFWEKKICTLPTPIPLAPAPWFR